MSLGINDFKEYVVIDGGKVYETGLFDHTAGREVLQGEGHSRLARGTEIYGAETVDGFNFLITGNRARTRFMLNTVDNHWKKVDNGKKNLPLNTIAFGRMEAAFQQDLDRDQITGLDYNVIEEVGQSALLEKEDTILRTTVGVLNR